jgi:hypothetical protein
MHLISAYAMRVSSMIQCLQLFQNGGSVVMLSYVIKMEYTYATVDNYSLSPSWLRAERATAYMKRTRVLINVFFGLSQSLLYLS